VSVLSRPIVIGVGGVSSSVGKTTLVCELLKAFPGFEAIKTTRGHYRSCGKDSEACCVSHLLTEEPVLRSGRAETFAEGKDTGRFWDAGASNVHWVIATDRQVEQGIKLAMARVISRGVFVEGNSFSEYVSPDYFLMVRRGQLETIKTSARRALVKSSAIFVSDLSSITPVPSQIELMDHLPIFNPSTLPNLVTELRKLAND
jgi:hypothetical protein